MWINVCIIMEANTEARIKAAAARLFTTKGYAATRTRDIAAEAGINLALLNYYFRSKENLYHIIMADNFRVFFREVLQILQHPESTIEEKITQVVEYYSVQLLANPDIPSFVINELRVNPAALLQQADLQNVMKGTIFFEQVSRYLGEKGSGMDPVQFILNLMGMTIFPFLAAPIIQTAFGMEKDQLRQVLEQRKKLIPLWINHLVSAASLEAPHNTS